MKKFLTTVPGTVAAAVTLAVVSALAGCTPTQQPIVSSTAAGASEAPVAEPTPTGLDEPAVITVAITTKSLNLLDAEGNVVDYFEFLDDGDAAIAGLTELFGSDPVIAPFEGDNHSWPGKYYSWGGFVLIDWIGGPGIPYGEDFAVRATSANESGIAIETLDGISIGSPSAAVAATGATNDSYEWEGEVYAWFEMDPLAVDNEFDNARVFVRTILDGEAGPVSELVAPSTNFGP